MKIEKLINQSLTQNKNNLDFIEKSRSLRADNQIIDGLGINYSKKNILTIKLYVKIVNTYPVISSCFKQFFFQESNFLNHGEKLLINSQLPHNTNRDIGLSGVALSFRHHITNSSHSSAVSGLKINKPINYSNSVDKSILGISHHRYYYIFNKLLKNLFLQFCKINLPINKHGLEIYFSGEGLNKNKDICPSLCFTVYPLFSQDIKSDLVENFKNLQKYEPWAIEKEIIDAIKLYNPRMIPITKGYQANKLSRKIYFSCLSYNFSSFL
jgi:hypothetical protein